MSLTIVVGAALVLSMLVYLAVGLKYNSTIRGVGDVLPILFGGRARVATHREFSASTVATTISLATVVVAFYQLVPGLGFWLLWTAITTALGLLVFRLFVHRIWTKMSSYDYRPTLHAYLGVEFDSKKLAFVASLFTTIGYLSAFAVELTVGSRFLAGLLPSVPQLVTVIVLTIVSFVYTALGGFRTVVVTDRIQMWFIWLFIIAMGAYLVVAGYGTGWSESISRIPASIRTPTWSSGLIPFVLGIAIMNLLMFICNMALWQRVSGTEEPEIVVRGMAGSVLGAAASWSLLVCLAVGAFMLVAPVADENILITLLKSIQATPGGRIVIFCAVLGLYGAMLSTASTQLIAVSHTVYEDLVAPFRSLDLQERAVRRREVFLSRAILVVSAIAAIAVVEVLRSAGFTVADLAFAVYGAALGLVPPILITLFVDRSTTAQLSVPAMIAVTGGFVSCWAVAAYGRLTGNGNMVFLSPVVSTIVATFVMAIGFAFVRSPTAALSRDIA